MFSSLNMLGKTLCALCSLAEYLSDIPILCGWKGYFNSSPLVQKGTFLSGLTVKI